MGKSVAGAPCTAGGGSKTSSLSPLYLRMTRSRSTQSGVSLAWESKDEPEAEATLTSGVAAKTHGSLYVTVMQLLPPLCSFRRRVA
jgi:hypothetical protein